MTLQNGSALAVTNTHGGSGNLVTVHLQAGTIDAITTTQLGNSNTLNMTGQRGTNLIIGNTQSDVNGMATFNQSGNRSTRLVRQLVERAAAPKRQ